MFGDATAGGLGLVPDASDCAGAAGWGGCEANAALLNRVAGGQLSNLEWFGIRGGTSPEADQCTMSPLSTRMLL